jgi:hypothetical protein
MRLWAGSWCEDIARNVNPKEGQPQVGATFVDKKLCLEAGVKALMA